MQKKVAVTTILAACTLFASATAFAAQSVATGSVVKLGDGIGSLAGVFNGTVVSGPGAPGSFSSFCLERYEYFNVTGNPYISNNLFVKDVTNATENATSTYYTNDATIHPEVGHTNNRDPISKATEWIFTQFSSNQAAYAGTQALANSTQIAIWYLEGELNNDMSLYTGNANAMTFVANATNAVAGGWTDVGDRVRVLNLYKDVNYTQHSQDQLYLMPVPEPETYAMMLAGLGLIGFVANRRRRKVM